MNDGDDDGIHKDMQSGIYIVGYIVEYSWIDIV